MSRLDIFKSFFPLLVMDQAEINKKSKEFLDREKQYYNQTLLGVEVPMVLNSIFVHKHPISKSWKNAKDINCMQATCTR